MEHVGLDLSATLTQVVVVSEKGQVAARLRVPTTDLPRWLAERPPSRVVMEACTQSPVIAQAARAAKHETFVVTGKLGRVLGIGARGLKNDDRDAEALARGSERIEKLPSVHARSSSARSLMQLLGTRAVLVKSRSQSSLHLKSWLRGQLIHVKARAHSAKFAEAVRKIAEVRFGGLPMAAEILVKHYETLTAQLRELDGHLEELAKQNETCGLLMTMPGVGPICSLMFVAHIDDISRFQSGEELASYLGLVPGEATTSFKIVRTRTIKAGPKYLRAQLVQSAWSMMLSRPNDPLVAWWRSIADRKAKKIAIVALARKMARVLWAMWKTQTRYDASRPSRAQGAATTS
jgi:transposase